MRALVMLILFLGMFLVVQGVYEERVRDLELRLSNAVSNIKEEVNPDLHLQYSKVEQQDYEPFDVVTKLSSSSIET
jgi:hypothetical protein